jgi:hypothetical protein
MNRSAKDVGTFGKTPAIPVGRPADFLRGAGIGFRCFWLNRTHDFLNCLNLPLSEEVRSRSIRLELAARVTKTETRSYNAGIFTGRYLAGPTALLTVVGAPVFLTGEVAIKGLIRLLRD